MARKGITYDDVERVADKLVSDGDQATIQRVRELLGTGSPNTIHKHLSSWRQTQPQLRRKETTLPAGLADALIKEIERRSLAACAEAEEKELEARRSADKLAEVGEALEEENEELKAKAQQEARERDKAQALADDRQHEIDRLVSAVEREQMGAEAARVDLAKARLAMDSYDEQIAERKQEIQRLSEKMDSEINLKQSAEQRAAVGESRVADLTAQMEALKVTLEDLETQLRDAERARSEGAVSESKVTYLTQLTDQLETKLSVSEQARYESMMLAERNQTKLEAANDRVIQLEEQITAFEKAKLKSQTAGDSAGVFKKERPGSTGP